MDIASLVLPVYLVYKSIRSKSTMANGLIIISSAVTFMIMVAYGVYTLLEIIRGAETFNIYSIIFHLHNVDKSYSVHCFTAQNNGN